MELIVQANYNYEDGCTADCCVIDCDFCGCDGACIDIN